MSKPVDERVVEMRFDNKQFEQNVQTSLSTLDKLKHSLNLEGATKGLANVNSAAKNCNMSGLTGAVETVHAKFSAFEVMAVTALANITNSVINTGKQMLHSLTIEPISQGFEEYELKMGSIQTIMMGTGASLKEVNEYLNELNTYSDKTIYSFQDMTSNIGKFTNAGVKLEDAVMAIQGVSNEAAISGANANEASRAMYNFAQALSAGYVKLIDWKSIENANMATVEFKTQLLEAAVAAGTVEKTIDGMYHVLTENNQGSTMDDAIDSTKNFNDSLQYQWMTTEVLVNTLRDYADETTDIGKRAFAAAQDVKTFSQLMDTLKEAVGSGWAMTWEILFGDFEEAKTLWTSLSKAIGGFIDAQSDTRNSMLQGWKDMGGRTALIEAIKDAFEGLVSVIKPISEGFREIFPPVTSERLYNLTVGLEKFTDHLKIGESASKNLKNTFKGLFAVLDIAKQAFSAIFNAIVPLFGGLDDLGGGVLTVTGGIGEWLVRLDEFIKKNEIFNKAIQGIVGFVGKAAGAFKNFTREVKDKFNLPDLETVKESVKDFLSTLKEKIKVPGLELVHSTIERIHERMSQIGKSTESMKDGVIEAIGAMAEALANCKFIQMFQALWNGVKTIVSGIAKALGGLADALIEKIGNADFSGIIDLLNGLSIGGIALAISKFLKSFTKPFEGLSGLLKNITGILDGVRGCFEAYQTNLKAGTLLKIATAIAILTASIVAISLIDSDKLSSSLGAITVLFGNLLGSLVIFNKISGCTGSTMKACATMISMAAAVSILAGAMKKVASLDWEGIAKGLVAIAGLSAIVVASAKIMSNGSGQLVKGATSLVVFAGAIKILTSVCEDLSRMKWEELARGLTGVGVLLGEMAIFLRIAKFSGKAISTATSIVILAAAMKILASACKDFGQMEWPEIGKGLTSVGLLLLEIVAFTNLTGNAKHVLSSGLALIEIAAAMKIFASAMADFGSFSWEQISKGLAAMGGALAEVAIATKVMPKNTVAIGMGLVIVGGALEIVADALGKMGNFSWEQIVKGLTTMGVALTELAVGLNFMKGTLSGSAAMFIAASALAVLTPVLSILGAMSWVSIAKGLITIAGAFTVLGIAGAILSPLIPTILGLGGAFALIGVGVLTIGAGLLAAGTGLSALAVGFTALAAAGTAGATAIVASLTVIITGVAGLIPAVIEKIGEGIIAFCKVIAAGAPAIGEAVKEVVLTLVDVLAECVPAILVKYTPQIVESIFQFLIKVLEGVSKHMPELIKAAIDALMSFYSGIVEALGGIDADVLLKGIVGIGLLSAIMLALSAMVSLVPGAMIGVLGMGAVIAELTLVLAAVGALAQIPGLSWLVSEGGKLLQGIGTAIGQFVGGIVGGFMSGISSQFPQIGMDLSSFMLNIQPFIEGASRIDPSMMDGVKALAETILILTAADILQGLTSWITGGSSLSEFATELVPFGVAMRDFSITIAGMDANLVANAAVAGKTLAEMAATLPNSGGVVGFFAGENDMTEFGNQLVPFGKAMMGFAESVKGLDADAVVNASTAGKAMAEMAATIPNSGGVVSFFSGENNMDAFGIQLISFGKAMKLYSESISGMDVAAVTNSAAAGKSIVELANTLPNTGGLISWFAGDNDMGAFGVSLVAFGENFALYSDYMKNVDAGIVSATTNAATSIVELQKSLPKEGGWFSDDMSLSDFGSDMSTFGSYFGAFYNHISGVDTEQLSNIISQTNRLVAMAKGMSELDTSGMSGFSTALIALGEAGVDGFINTFNNAYSRVTTSVNNMLTAFINAANAKKSSLTVTFLTLVQTVLTAINSKQSLFTIAGSMLMISFASGVRSQDTNSRTTLMNTISGCLTVVKNKYAEFQSVGQSCMIKFIAGVRLKSHEINNAFTSSLSGVITSIRNYNKDFYNAGSYMVDGFADGIKDNAYKAAAKARAMAKKAAQAAKDELDEHSPSKVGYHIGAYFGVAFVNAIGDYVDKAYNASANLARSAQIGLRDTVSKIMSVIDENIDTQPTIQPVLDLSNITAGTRQLNALFSRSQAISIGNGMKRVSGEEKENGVAVSKEGGTYHFIQNNYSPKALSRVEIYRQTKNQFSTMERMVKA